MAVILGIDIGTSSVKGMLLDTEKGVLGVKTKSYGVDIPRPGWAQQDPELWWNSLKEVLNMAQIPLCRGLRKHPGSGIFRTDAWAGSCRRGQKTGETGNYLAGSAFQKAAGRNLPGLYGR